MTAESIQNVNNGVERFISYDNPLIAFEFLMLCVFALFIYWRESKRDRIDRESVEANKELAKQMAIMAEIIRGWKHD